MAPGSGPKVEAWVSSTARFRDGGADCTEGALAGAAAHLCAVAAAAPAMSSSGISRFGPAKLLEMMRPQAEGARSAASPRAPAGKKRKCSANAGAWGELLHLESPPLVPPTDAKTFREALALLDAWLAGFPAQFLHGKGPATAKGFYQRKLICRKFAHSMARRLPQDAFQDLTVADLMPANADVQGHVAAAFPDTASWTEMQRATGVHPVLVGCWCCLMSNLPPARQELLENTSAKVVDVIARLSSDLGHAPSLEQVTAGLCE